jgi:hypothetical protein
MKRVKPKGWTSINCGTSRRLSDILPWWPPCTAYCVPPNMTRPSETSFNVNSSLNLRVAPRFGVVLRRRKACGAWSCVSVPAWPKARPCRPLWRRSSVPSARRELTPRRAVATPLTPRWSAGRSGVASARKQHPETAKFGCFWLHLLRCKSRVKLLMFQRCSIPMLLSTKASELVS